jgi:YVTN family beta-propeller protein
MRRRRAVSMLVVSGFLLAGCSHLDGPPAVSVGMSTAGSVGASGLAQSGASNADEAMDSSAMSASGIADFTPSTPAASSRPPVSSDAASSPSAPWIDVLPGMPPVVDPHNIYSEAGAGMLGPLAQQEKEYAYVPDSKAGDVWVIDQRTFQVVNKFPVGKEVQHVVLSHDMTSLYATDDVGNVIRRIDPITGQPGDTIPVADPYNMYFTPDGKYAISVAEELRSLVWYDPVTWQEVDRVQYPECQGLDHGDFTPDGKIAVFSCEFAGRVAVVDMQTHQLIRMVDMPQRDTHMGPQDLRTAPDGSRFYIADSDSNGVWVLDQDLQTVTRHIDTGKGAHGLYFSRDATRLFVSNRLEGSISVLDAYTGDPITKWQIPGGGSPDMGNVTADGSQLWLSGRYDNVVYVISTIDGNLITRIGVGNGPHGLALTPQPGRYSTGHTGITR